MTSVGFVGTLLQVVPEPGNLHDLSQSQILSEPHFFLAFIPVKLLFTGIKSCYNQDFSHNYYSVGSNDLKD